MKILVTGANGQLGNELHKQLDKEFPGCVLYTDVDTLDLTDAKAVEAFVVNNDITHVVNCASYTAVDKAEEEKMQCARVNIDAVKNIAMAADANGAKIIHFSTDYVFDGTNHRPYKESDKVNPISQYGTTKRKGETAMLRLSETQKEIRVVCDQIGTPTYVRDLAHAVVKVLRSHQWVPGIYHFTDEGAASWYDFAKAIFRITGRNVKVTPIVTEDYPTPASRPPYSILDKTRIKATYGVEIPHWESALADCLNEMGVAVKQA